MHNIRFLIIWQKKYREFGSVLACCIRFTIKKRANENSFCISDRCTNSKVIKAKNTLSLIVYWFWLMLRQFSMIVTDIQVVPLVMVYYRGRPPATMVASEAKAILVFIEMMPRIVRPPMIMKGLHRPSMVVQRFFGAVPVDTTMAFFTIIIAQWVYFFFMCSSMAFMMASIVIVAAIAFKIIRVSYN